MVRGDGSFRAVQQDAMSVLYQQQLSICNGGVFQQIDHTRSVTTVPGQPQLINRLDAIASYPIAVGENTVGSAFLHSSENDVSAS